MDKSKTKARLEYLLSLSVAIALSLLIGAFIMMVYGKSPIEGYGALIHGAFGSKYNIANTMAKTVPLVLTGLATAIAFNSGISNIGGEGQLYLGAFAAAYIGFTFTSLPAPVAILLAIAASAVAGGLYAFIPGILKVRYKVDEVITTIMLNSVAISFTSYLVNYPFQPSTGKINGTEMIASNFSFTRLVRLSTLNTSIFYSIGIAIVIYYLMQKTAQGYDFKVTGQNKFFSRFGGLNDKFIMVGAMVISGALCGIAGAFEVYGVHYRFLQQISPGYSWDGMLAALIVKNNPIGVVLMCIFLAALKTGSIAMENTTGIPSELVSVIQSIIILFIAGEQGFKQIYTNFKLKRKAMLKAGEKNA